jgi:ribosomal protein S28E/S33
MMVIIQPPVQSARQDRTGIEGASMKVPSRILAGTDERGRHTTHVIANQ